MDELRTYLYELENQGLVKIWDDREIMAGAQWKNEIRKALLSAEMAVLLVTQDFIASPFIRSEELPPLVKAAKSADVKLFWIAFSSCTFEGTVIEEFNAVNSPEKPIDMFEGAYRNKEYKEIYKKIKAGIGGKRLMK